MEKIKVIDLLNKIANGEEVPKKIKVFETEYEFNDEDKTYQRWFNDICCMLGEDRCIDVMLDYEVEIIEDTPREGKKIEKMKKFTFDEMITKINEIIEVINERNI